MKRLVENLPLIGIVMGATYGRSSPPRVQLSKGKVRGALVAVLPAPIFGKVSS